MKDLDKMTKEELKKIIRKLEGEKEEMKENDEIIDVEETKEKIEKLLDGASCIICCTDKGILNIGYTNDVMNMLTKIAQTLKEEMPKDLIKFAIENGLCDDGSSAVKHLLEAMSEMMKNKLGE